MKKSRNFSCMMEERGDDHLQTNERNIFQGFHFFEESLPSTFSLGEPLLENPVWERKWKDRRAGTKAIHFDGEVLCIEYSKKKKRHRLLPPFDGWRVGSQHFFFASMVLCFSLVGQRRPKEGHVRADQRKKRASQSTMEPSF